MNQLKFYDAVMRTINTDTLWKDPENLTPEIRSDGDHYLTGMTTDASRLFLTFYDPYRSGEIYTSRLDSGKWSVLERLNENVNTLFNESHASPSPDGKYLYFTSDRKGGYGGLDIYRSSLNASGDWDPPVNLGPLVNSPCNEETPFITPDSKKLFFSSQGHYNMGGYDVFMSEPDNNGNWLPPVNIGYPLNTTDDDLFFFPLGSGKTAYHAVYDPGTGQQDILRYNILSFGNPARFTVHGKVNITGDVDYNAGNISLTIIDKKDRDTLFTQQLKDDGSFRHNVPAGDFAFDFSNQQGSLLVKELSIPGYFPHNQLILNADITVSPGITTDTIRLRDIRFAFDKSQLDTMYRGFLDEIIGALAEHPDLKLQLNGYADSKGRESYNLELSEKRARVVENYLKGKHIDPARISVDALGEKSPVAKNQYDNGADNPRGRSFNRRVELLFDNLPAQLVVIRQNDIPEDLLDKDRPITGN